MSNVRAINEAKLQAIERFFHNSIDSARASLVSTISYNLLISDKTHLAIRMIGVCCSRMRLIVFCKFSGSS